MKHIDTELVLTTLMNLNYSNLPEQEVAMIVRGANLYIGKKVKESERANGLRVNKYQPILNEGAVKTNLIVNLENTRQDLGLPDHAVLKGSDEMAAQLVAGLYNASFHRQRYYDQLLGQWYTPERDYFNIWTSGSTAEELGKALDEKVMLEVELARSGGYARAKATAPTEECIDAALKNLGRTLAENGIYPPTTIKTEEQLGRGFAWEVDIDIFQQPVEEPLEFGFAKHAKERKALHSKSFQFNPRTTIAPIQPLEEVDVVEVTWAQAIEMYREELSTMLPELIKGTERDVETILKMAETQHIPVVGWALKELIEKFPKNPLIGIIKTNCCEYQTVHLNPNELKK